MAPTPTTLPAGWTVSNSSGTFSGPPPLDSDDEILALEAEAEGLDLAPDSPGWEDVDPADDADGEVAVRAFFGEEIFGSAVEMVEGARKEGKADFRGALRTFRCDFIAAIKLVNYIRTQAAAGQTQVDLSDPKAWEDEKFLTPAVEGDALLFCLGEFDEIAEAEALAEEEAAKVKGDVDMGGASSSS